MIEVLLLIEKSEVGDNPLLSISQGMRRKVDLPLYYLNLFPLTAWPGSFLDLLPASPAPTPVIGSPLVILPLTLSLVRWTHIFYERFDQELSNVLGVSPR